ncbi:TetR/AcrR family transcriptional regulator [Novosphingobium beihaiensis]|uniref:TetR/AcrR family transcriptional regulator n=1 Tax=Novosphingobium beihaiensis TaxID=2930389 RepID=UPI001FB9C170|nr:TetR/AcrR family transcriptional regulator [Novosphingobium beihaiensis]
MSIPVIFDPCQPVARMAAPGGRVRTPGYNQRQRRSTILATIRRLLMEDGLEGVTVRRIAEQSGHAVQTIYNLVGPRDHAIGEAINEYAIYVNLTATPDPFDPEVPAAMLDRELASIRINPEFSRNVCRIYFSDARQIFYDFREQQIKTMHRFLMQQQRSGVVRSDISARFLAEQLMLFLGATCVEWADRGLDFEELRERLCGGYETIMASALCRGDLRFGRGDAGALPTVPDSRYA